MIYNYKYTQTQEWNLNTQTFSTANATFTKTIFLFIIMHWITFTNKLINSFPVLMSSASYSQYYNMWNFFKQSTFNDKDYKKNDSAFKTI